MAAEQSTAEESLILTRYQDQLKTKDNNNGHQTKRLAAVGQGRRGAFYRRSTHGPAVPGSRAGTRGGRGGHVRAGRAHGVAQPPAGADAGSARRVGTSTE